MTYPFDIESLGPFIDALAWLFLAWLERGGPLCSDIGVCLDFCPPCMSENATEVRRGPWWCPPLLKPPFRPFSFSASSASFSAFFTFKMDEISVSPDIPLACAVLADTLVRLIVLPAIEPAIDCFRGPLLFCSKFWFSSGSSFGRWWRSEFWWNDSRL